MTAERSWLPLEVHVHSHDQSFLEKLCVVLIGRREDVLHDQFGLLDRARQRHRARGKNIVRRQLARAHDVEASNHVGDEAVHLLEVSNEIPRQLRVLTGQLRRTHRSIALVKLLGIEELTWRGRGQSKSFWRLDLVQLLQDPITLRPFRLPDDVKAPEPGSNRDAAQEKNPDCPGEEVGLLVLKAAVIIDSEKDPVPCQGSQPSSAIAPRPGEPVRTRSRSRRSAPRWD